MSCHMFPKLVVSDRSFGGISYDCSKDMTAKDFLTHSNVVTVMARGNRQNFS